MMCFSVILDDVRLKRNVSRIAMSVSVTPTALDWAVASHFLGWATQQVEVAPISNDSGSVPTNWECAYSPARPS